MNFEINMSYKVSYWSSGDVLLYENFIYSLFWVVRKPRHSEVSHMRKSQMRDNSLKRLTELNIEDREIGNKLRILQEIDEIIETEFANLFLTPLGQMQSLLQWINRYLIWYQHCLSVTFSSICMFLFSLANIYMKTIS